MTLYYLYADTFITYMTLSLYSYLVMPYSLIHWNNKCAADTDSIWPKGLRGQSSGQVRDLGERQTRPRGNWRQRRGEGNWDKMRRDRYTMWYSTELRIAMQSWISLGHSWKTLSHSQKLSESIGGTGHTLLHDLGIGPNSATISSVHPLGTWNPDPWSGLVWHGEAVALKKSCWVLSTKEELTG